MRHIGWISGIVLVLAGTIIGTPLAMAQRYTVLDSFTGGADGSNPSGLIRDSAGNLYGTTSTAAKATESFSSSIRRARRPCCTASREERMGRPERGRDPRLGR